MCLRGLPGLPALDAVGEPASLAERWTTWKAEFELHVTALQISNLLKRELFYFSLLDPDFNSFWSSRGRERLWQSFGQFLGQFQAQNEGSNGSTDLSSGKTISWWDYQQFIIRLQKLEVCLRSRKGKSG